MRLLISAFVFFCSFASADEARTFIDGAICKGIAFRQNGGVYEPNNRSRINLKLIRVDEKLFLEEYSGHVEVRDYYGTFNGTKLVETPYQRPSTYLNHLQFTEFDAVATGGSENGMWGKFVISKEILNRDGAKTFDAHYVFQAGDHMGGTVDFECARD